MGFEDVTIGSHGSLESGPWCWSGRDSSRMRSTRPGGVRDRGTWLVSMRPLPLGCRDETTAEGEGNLGEGGRRGMRTVRILPLPRRAAAPSSRSSSEELLDQRRRVDTSSEPFTSRGSEMRFALRKLPRRSGGRYGEHRGRGPARFRRGSRSVLGVARAVRGSSIRQSDRLLTDRLWVRVPPPELPLLQGVVEPRGEGPHEGRIGRVGQGVLLVQDIGAGPLERLAGLAPEVDSDHRIVGTVADGEAGWLDVQDRLPSWDSRDETAERDHPRRTWALRTEGPGVAHHRALGEAAEDGLLRRDPGLLGERVEPVPPRCIGGRERLGIWVADLSHDVP